jgi:hypothetical protein
MNNTDVIPGDKTRANSKNFRARFFTTSYVAISAIAMIGWLIALGLAANKIVNWLFF